jgi:(2Fe-2S) ferredoxin
MPILKTLQDLTLLRNNVRQTMAADLNTGTAIYVGMGTCGIAAGARQTMEAIQAELEKRRIDARVSAVGCIGMCVKEPLVDIQQGGGSHVLYANIRPDMVGRLIEEHVINGRPVRQWVICRIPAEQAAEV